MGLRSGGRWSERVDMFIVDAAVFEESLVLSLGLDIVVSRIVFDTSSPIGFIVEGSPLTHSCSILWTAVFGIFGKLYIPAHPTPKQSGQRRMKNAVWVDLTNMLLWLVTAIWGTIEFFRHRGGRTLHTGRAKA